MLQKSQKKRLEKVLSRLVEKEHINQQGKKEMLNRITFSNEINDIKDSDIVIEAIIEDLSIKQDIFCKVEEIVSKECIIASNTSSLSIASIASACKNPSRVLGVHFFNPAPLMPLVEIVPSVQTSKDTLERGISIINEWNKVTVVAKDTPGFIVNRVARPFYGESLRIYEV